MNLPLDRKHWKVLAGRLVPKFWVPAQNEGSRLELDALGIELGPSTARSFDLEIKPPPPPPPNTQLRLNVLGSL